MAENGDGQPPLKKADETAAALLFDIVEELFPTAAEQKGFLVDQIFYIHHQLVGVRVRDDRAAAVHQKGIAVFGTGAERRQLAHVRQRGGDETDADDFAVFLDRHELGEIHVARGPGREGVAELPFAGSHDPGDIVALQLGDFGPQRAGNGAVRVHHADHPELEGLGVGLHAHGAVQNGNGGILDQRLFAHALKQIVGRLKPGCKIPGQRLGGILGCGFDEEISGVERTAETDADERGEHQPEASGKNSADRAGGIKLFTGHRKRCDKNCII